MPRCVFCGTQFLYASMSGPAEPCDCGLNYTREQARELTEEQIRERQQIASGRNYDQSRAFNRGA